MLQPPTMTIAVSALDDAVQFVADLTAHMRLQELLRQHPEWVLTVADDDGNELGNRIEMTPESAPAYLAAFTPAYTPADWHKAIWQMPPPEVVRCWAVCDELIAVAGWNEDLADADPLPQTDETPGT